MTGGYRPSSRAGQLLDEIALEALVAAASRSRGERDRAFAEIERLARQSAQCLSV